MSGIFDTPAGTKRSILNFITVHHHLQVSTEDIDQINIRTVDQGNDQSGEWVLQRQGHMTATIFGDIIRWKVSYIPLIIKLLCSKQCRTKAMQYVHDNKPKAHNLYCEYI